MRNRLLRFLLALAMGGLAFALTKASIWLGSLTTIRTPLYFAFGEIACWIMAVVVFLVTLVHE